MFNKFKELFDVFFEKCILEMKKWKILHMVHEYLYLIKCCELPLIFKISFAGEQYLKKEKQDFDTLKSDATSNHNNCWDWCNNNIHCGGFYVLNTTCHFVNGNDVKSAGCRDLYVKKGIISKNNTTKIKLILSY